MQCRVYKTETITSHYVNVQYAAHAICTVRYVVRYEICYGIGTTCTMYALWISALCSVWFVHESPAWPAGQNQCSNSLPEQNCHKTEWARSENHTEWNENRNFFYHYCMWPCQGHLGRMPSCTLIIEWGLSSNANKCPNMSDGWDYSLLWNDCPKTAPLSSPNPTNRHLLAILEGTLNSIDKLHNYILSSSSDHAYIPCMLYYNFLCGVEWPKQAYNNNEGTEVHNPQRNFGMRVAGSEITQHDFQICTAVPHLGQVLFGISPGKTNSPRVEFDIDCGVEIQPGGYSIHILVPNVQHMHSAREESLERMRFHVMHIM